MSNMLIDLYRKMTEHFRPEIFDDSEVRPVKTKDCIIGIIASPRSTQHIEKEWNQDNVFLSDYPHTVFSVN